MSNIEDTEEEAAHQFSPDWEGVACPMCPLTLRKGDGLKNHMEKTHKKGTVPIREVEDFSAGYLEGYDMSDIIHPEDKTKVGTNKVKCPFCPKVLLRGFLKGHLMLHNCDDEGELKAHRRREHSENLCPICKTKLGGEAKMVGHLVSKHNVVLRGSKFHCPGCPRALKTTSGLLKHMTQHETKLPQRPSTSPATGKHWPRMAEDISNAATADLPPAAREASHDLGEGTSEIDITEDWMFKKEEI